MSGLEELLANATPGPWSIDRRFASHLAVYGRVIEGVARTLVTEIDISYDVPFDRAECENDARLIALAPDLARLALDMGEALTELRAEPSLDFGDCRAECCDHPGCLKTRRFDALLARLDGVAKAEREGIVWPLTAGEQGERPDGTGQVAPADGCAERQSTAAPSPAASEEGADTR